MSRLSYVGVLLSVAFLVQSLAAQDRTITKHAMVQHVLVRDRGEDIEVEIQTSGAPVSPDTQVITGPDRIIVDFPGTLPSSSLRALKVDRGALKDIRSGLFFSNPPITRIVLDLSEPQSYQISTIESAIVVRSARLRDASLASGQNVPTPHLSPASASVGAVTRAGVSQANLSNAS